MTIHWSSGVRRPPKATPALLFIGEDKDKQLTTLWKDAEIEIYCPWARVEEVARNIMNREQENDDREQEHISHSQDDWLGRWKAHAAQAM